MYEFDMSETFEKILKEASSKPIVHPELSLEYQLGIYIGDYIASNNLPTLSTDMMQSKKCLKVSEEDTKEHTRLHDLWWNKLHPNGWISKSDVNAEAEWAAYLEFRKSLEVKYLPHKLDTYVHRLSSIRDMEELKKGIRTALWDCDICSYDTDIVEVENTEFSTRVSIYLRKEYVPQETGN